MKVLIACEFSGIVRDAFRDLGHNAWSVDKLSTEREGIGHHIVGDALDCLDAGWDLMIAHPPCTDIAISGAKHFAKKGDRPQKALDFVQALMDAPIPRIAIENPVSLISSRIRKPDQIVQPWWFGHPETKATCLWLKGLPPLTPTNSVKPFKGSRCHREPPGFERWRKRSRTYEGFARAMAEQWGGH